MSAMNGLKNGDVIPYNIAEWLPSDQRHIDRWVSRLLRKIEDQTEQSHLVEMHHTPLHPAIRNFKKFIEDDSAVFMFFNQMFTQIPRRQRHTDPTGDSQIRDYRIMLQVLNVVISTAPEFNQSSLVGFPINAILDWPMGTPSGYSAFLNEKVNMHLKYILNEWGKFLQTEASCSTLTDDPRHGWFGEDAQRAMPTFVDDFICDPTLPHHGFKSWDQFFTRQFRPGKRPIEIPENDAVVGHACESSPYRIAYHVKRVDDFWIKAQRYSLYHMMGTDDLSNEFTNGTVYQAFLSALCYHRWHSPVSGTIVKIKHISGTYYSETRSAKYDPCAPNESQGFLTEVATRCCVFIRADSAHIGLMCFIAVGMAEVSTCEVTVSEGQHVTRGEEIGMFHFGGSTHCLVFGPHVNLQFELGGIVPGTSAPVCRVNSILAHVLPPISAHEGNTHAKRVYVSSDSKASASVGLHTSAQDKLSCSEINSSSVSHHKKARLY